MSSWHSSLSFQSQRICGAVLNSWLCVILCDALKIPFCLFNWTSCFLFRSFLCIIGGVITGILGCTGFHGFLSFVILYLSLAVSIGLKINFDFKSYMHSTLTSFLFTDLQKNGLSFILFWTLTYALIYIY